MSSFLHPSVFGVGCSVFGLRRASPKTEHQIPNTEMAGLARFDIGVRAVDLDVRDRRRDRVVRAGQLGRHQDHQLALTLLEAAVLEQLAQDRDLREERDRLRLLVDVVLQQAADRQRLAVLDPHYSVRAARPERPQLEPDRIDPLERTTLIELEWPSGRFAEQEWLLPHDPL